MANKKVSTLKRVDQRAVLKTVVFSGLTLVSLALFVVGLIGNSNGAVERFDRLVAVDAAGGDVEEALTDLREYIYSHMNTELGGPNGIYPPIQLNGTYQRLVEAEKARVTKVNEAVRLEADRVCAAQFGPGQIQARAQCNGEYIEANGTSEQEIDESFYKFNYVAPRWSPDLAGFSLIAAIIFGILALYNGLHHWYVKRTIRLGQ